MLSTLRKTRRSTTRRRGAATRSCTAGNAGDWDVIRNSHEKSMREAMSEILAAREAGRAEREAKGEPAPDR